MNKKALLAIFTTFVLFSANSQVFGQTNEVMDISQYFETESFTSGVAEIVETSKMTFVIGPQKDVQVHQIIEGMIWGPENPKVLKIPFSGKHSNLKVTDEDGTTLPSGFVGETFEESEYVILAQKPLEGFDLVIKYDLENFLEKTENGMWTKKFVYPHDVMIYFEEEVETIFANSRPVDVSNAKGINCIGCTILIEFFDDKKPVVKKVLKNENKFEEMSNTGKEFDLKFFSDGKVTDVNYIQELDYFSFSVNKDDQLVWIEIPLDLILSPYHVYLTENDQEILTEGDKIRKTEFNLTETHTNLTFRASTGVIHVVGSSEMEHEEQLSQLEIRKIGTSSNTINANQAEIEDETNIQELYENWGKAPDENGDTVIFIIIGIAIAIGIGIGIAIKLKKN